MARSMTAFARASTTAQGETWCVEIRSMNHRFFEISLKLPSMLSEFEGKIKDAVHKEMGRGKVYVSIIQTLSDENSYNMVIDEKAADFYFSAAKKLKKQYKLTDDLSLKDLLTLPKVLTVEKKVIDADKIWIKIQRLLHRALKEASQAKTLEGRELVSDVESRLTDIGKAAQRVKKAAEGNSERYLKKLQERMLQVLNDHELDDDRLLREAALMAERTDITEELVRLDSHLKLFRKKIKSLGEVGRELDFFCQEINREINTIGSKAQSLDISHDVICMKKELEKIREQVQNIE